MTTINNLIEQIGRVVLGKETEIRLALTCALARGHLLLEDLPGMGKTTLAHTLANVLGLSFNRVQFTSDLLPADITGGMIFIPEEKRFEFRKGPIFNQVLLADEINRASPKTQSALLEAMEEKQVTVENGSYPLPDVFFVIASQNPGYQLGTFGLPESQLDRFLMKVSLGYPDPDSEKRLLLGQAPSHRSLEKLLSEEELVSLQKKVEQVAMKEPVVLLIQEILKYSRQSGVFTHGLSPRAGIGLVAASKAWAIVHERNYVIPEDVIAVVEPVVNHRLVFAETAQHKLPSEVILSAIKVPV